MRYIEDPSIAWAALAECDRVWADIDRMTGKGEWFFRAREVVLAREYPVMAKTYGKAVADRVTKVIQSRDYGDLSPATWRAIRDRGKPPVPAKPPSTGAGWFAMTGLAFVAVLMFLAR